ncbi:hypothetical protein [Nonomuraea sp. NPDC046570]|uniref:hypothetical protein n=1 Tax=Nonomuraea sp. NPDC046570 TaxID=3155255 RepID=UPI0033F9B41B
MMPRVLPIPVAFALVAGVFPAQPARAEFDPSKPFQIQMSNRLEFCALPGSAKRQIQVEIRPCDEAAVPNDARWTWSKQTRQLRHVGTGRCAGVYGDPALVRPVTLVECATTTADPAQRWGHDDRQRITGGGKSHHCWVVVGSPGPPLRFSAFHSPCNTHHYHEFKIAPVS